MMREISYVKVLWRLLMVILLCLSCLVGPIAAETPVSLAVFLQGQGIEVPAAFGRETPLSVTVRQHQYLYAEEPVVYTDAATLFAVSRAMENLDIMAGSGDPAGDTGPQTHITLAYPEGKALQVSFQRGKLLLLTRDRGGVLYEVTGLEVLWEAVPPLPRRGEENLALPNG